MRIADRAFAVRTKVSQFGFGFQGDPDDVYSRGFLCPKGASLGQLHDEQGDLETAAVHYARFVELWAEADPELQPRVRAAQARLEEIVRERG